MKRLLAITLFLFLINGVFGVNVTQCGTLSQSNVTYDLMNNVTSSGTCFQVQASNFTFNLHGHVINYAQSQTGYGFYDNWSNRDNVTITNGTLIGGNNYGSHAIYTQSDGSDNLNFNNLNITVNGNETSAIRLGTGSSVTISNNTINTQSNKNDPCSHYGGWATIELSHVGGKIDIHDNTITGKGMAGIQMSMCGTFSETAKIYDNYVRMWSAVRDGYAIAVSGGNNSCGGGTQIFNNTIDQENGRGIIIDGWNNGAYGPGNIEIFENDVTVREGYDCEYNAAGTAIGLRARFGAHDLDIHDNIFKGFAGLGVANGSGNGDGAEVEGSHIGAQEPYGQNIKFYDNIINVSTNNANYKAIGIYVSGGTTSQDAAQTYYHNNTITSNNIGITVSYNDGVGTDSTLTSDEIIQGTNPLDYRPVALGWWEYGARDIDFVDLIGINATSHQDIFFDDQPGVNHDVNFSWFLTVQVKDSSGNPIPNASVTVTNKFGTTRTGVTNNQGKFTPIVEEVIYLGTITGTGYPTATNYNPYSVKATYNGQTQTQSNITMNTSKTINFQFTLTPCTNGTTQNCTTSQNCAGTQTCTTGTWGNCNDIPNDGCPAECEEDWTCTIWSACVDGQQNRTCTDNNNCGTTDNKPIEIQECGECTNGTTQNCTTNQSCPGTQTCTNNLWGNCVDIAGDNCPATEGTAIIADHTSVAEFDSIPEEFITAAKNNFRIAYSHTSHGSQPVTGIEMLWDELGSPFDYTSSYATDDCSAGNFLCDHYPASATPGVGETGWVTTTRNMLNNNIYNRNVVIWSWCWEVADSSAADIQLYLDEMSQLEADYPNITFVYMTGHLDGTGDAGNLRQRNEQIRQYAQTHGKILFDFEDIESWDPAGNYYANDTDACNWCYNWCSTNDCPTGTCINNSSYPDCHHSHCFNCYNKGKTFWWMMAKIAGWQGETGCTNGQTRDCTTTENCDGTQTCVNNSWGVCNDIADDGCPFILGNMSTEQVNPATDINVTKNEPFTFSTTVTCNSGVCGDVTAILDPEITKKINQTTDNAFIYHTSIELGESFNHIGNSPYDGTCTTGLKFNSIDIPKASLINSAYIEMIARGDRQTDTVNAVLKTQIADNPATFSTYSNFINRVKSQSSVSWNNIPHFTVFQKYTTPDISSIIQEAINNANWQEGDNIVVFIEDNQSTAGADRIIINYNDLYYPNKEATLVINYSVDENQQNQNPKGIIPTTVGATPFYTTNNNPQTCSDMLQGETCTTSWNVIPTGTAGEIYSFYVTYNSEYSGIAEQNTPVINITITEETACEEDWTCTIWNECIDGEQTRTCTDNNDCGTTDNKPYEIQECGECTNETTQNCTTNEACPGTQTCTNNLWGECTDIANDNCPIEPECETGKTQKCYTTEDCQGTQECNSGFWGLCNKLPNQECINCTNSDSYTCGDLDLSGSIPDISDLIYLVNYLFLGGPEPLVDCSANVDGIEEVSISDLIYMVNYMFQDGPEMQCSEVN